MFTGRIDVLKQKNNWRGFWRASLRFRRGRANLAISLTTESLCVTFIIKPLRLLFIFSFAWKAAGLLVKKCNLIKSCILAYSPTPSYMKPPKNFLLRSVGLYVIGIRRMRKTFIKRYIDSHLSKAKIDPMINACTNSCMKTYCFYSTMITIFDFYKDLGIFVKKKVKLG